MVLLVVMGTVHGSKQCGETRSLIRRTPVHSRGARTNHSHSRSRSQPVHLQHRRWKAFRRMCCSMAAVSSAMKPRSLIAGLVEQRMLSWWQRVDSESRPQGLARSDARMPCVGRPQQQQEEEVELGQRMAWDSEPVQLSLARLCDRADGRGVGGQYTALRSGSWCRQCGAAYRRRVNRPTSASRLASRAAARRRHSARESSVARAARAPARCPMHWCIRHRSARGPACRRFGCGATVRPRA